MDSKQNIIITGGSGFLGSFLVEEYKKNGLSEKNIFIPRSKDYNLTLEKDIKKMYADFPADKVVHLAANVGGIGYNKKNPGSLFYDNLMMGAQIMEQARQSKIKKFVAIGTICAYPKFTPIPFKEENLWKGYPEETNAPYGLAKKMMLVQSQAYRDQYDFNSIYLLPVNLYGPRDTFDPEKSHVIPALIKKIYDAKINGDDYIEVWGSGKPTREFLYVKDAARGIFMAAENYEKSEPVNLGSGMEISIKDLIEKLVSLMDYKGEIKWDNSKPDGQPRRCLDVSKAEKEFGFKAETSFAKGLKETIAWYKEARKNKIVV
ncbi:MAG: GDP-L-fucose synthase [bacterium]